MNTSISERIEAIQKQIGSSDFSVEVETVDGWVGADVTIRRPLGENVIDFPVVSPDIVISLQESVPQKRIVSTECSKELSWLFLQLGDAFRETIDYVSKYDFYGSLAQAAMEHLEANKEEGDCKDLLEAVLERARIMINN